MKHAILGLMLLMVSFVYSQDENKNTNIIPTQENTKLENTQEKDSTKILLTTPKAKPEQYFTMALYGGYDFPKDPSNHVYRSVNPGYLFGVNMNYYWSAFGLGFYVDYINNPAKNTYPTDRLFFEGNPIDISKLSESNIKRILVGVGPGVKIQNASHRINFELYARAGISTINGGSVSLRSSYQNMLLNATQGFKSNTTLFGKLAARANFYFTDNIGINLGVYYIRHFQVNEAVQDGYAAIYRDIQTTPNTNNVLNALQIRKESCNCDYDSYGVTLGLSFKFGKVKEQTQYPYPIAIPEQSSKYTLTVNAVDKYSNERIPFADVVLKNNKQEIIKTGTTNHFGVVVFEDVVADDYKVESKLYNDDLEGTSINSKEFKNGEALQKKVIYTKNIIIAKGRVLDCNTKKPLANATVYAENINPNFNKKTVTNENGEFVIKLDSGKNYKIYASKSLYFSEIKELATNGSRENSLFMSLELCAENADCGNSIKLNKIYYDFDKATLRPEAYPELEKLRRFLVDNPSANVELSSHTDSRGSDAYNQKLSDNRAKSAVDYLVKNGISRNRMLPVGMGESKLLNQCKNGVKCNDEEHLVNRRTEMKVICIKK